MSENPAEFSDFTETINFSMNDISADLEQLANGCFCPE
jgi:hypothetical protein